jgi:hypothetical protein
MSRATLKVEKHKKGGGLNCVLKVKIFSQIKLVLQRIKHKLKENLREIKNDTRFILVPLTN